MIPSGLVPGIAERASSAEESGQGQDSRQASEEPHADQELGVEPGLPLGIGGERLGVYSRDGEAGDGPAGVSLGGKDGGVIEGCALGVREGGMLESGVREGIEANEGGEGARAEGGTGFAEENSGGGGVQDGAGREGGAGDMGLEGVDVQEQKRIMQDIVVQGLFKARQQTGTPQAGSKRGVSRPVTGGKKAKASGNEPSNQLRISSMFGKPKPTEGT